MIDINEYTDEKGRFDGRYLLIRPLNTDGATADVWLSLDLNTVSLPDGIEIDHICRMSDDEIEKIGLMVAIKIYRPQNALDIEGEKRFRDEYMIVFNCHHANLIHPTNFSIYKDTPYLVLPYCKQGSSELLIGNTFSSDDIWKYIHDVAAGLNYLHHCNPPIIHQDIKPANVLIDDLGNYAITDFGISAKRMKQYNHQSDNDDYEEQSGTFAYMAPERFIEGNIPSAEGDIWAFGAALYELLTGSVPYGEDGGQFQADGNVSLPFKGTQVANDIKNLICTCLSKNPADRPTARQLLDAANQKKFNTVKKPNYIGIILGILCMIAVAGTMVWKLSPPQTVIEERPIPGSASIEQVQTVDELFNEAMLLVDAGTADSVQMGIKKLEALADSDYVPAMYQLAVTFGGMTREELHKARKKLLQIDLKNQVIGDPAVAEITPKSGEYNNRAIDYYTRIVDLSLPEYSELNMKAEYRLGFYNYHLKNNKQAALGYFIKAKESAINLNDRIMAADAERYINFCQDN